MPPDPPAWRERLLAGIETAAPLTLLDPRPFPDRDYTPRQAVRWGVRAGGPAHVIAWWDFTVLGGSFGQADATAFTDAVAAAIEQRLPLVTVLASGGTRLQEGMAALVGIARARLALQRLAAAGLPHIAVCDQPTTGGVWIGIGSRADLRVAVRGAVIGFAGPRVIEAVTGTSPGPDSHTADAAAAAGLVDAVVDGEQVVAWADAAVDLVADRRVANGPVTEAQATDGLATVGLAADGQTVDGQAVDGAAARGQPADGTPAPAWVEPRRTTGEHAVTAARARTISGRQLLDHLGGPGVALAAPHGDTSVAARLTRLGHRAVVAVAIAAELGGRPTPDGYRLLTRAAGLAGRIGLPLVLLVDTPGAEPGAVAESDGIAAAIGAGMDAVLGCASPTVAVVHGEGGSGGALAGAVADVALGTPECYFAALGPEGAAAVLRTDVADADELMGITPAHLLAAGFLDRVVTLDELPAAIGWALGQLDGPPDARLAVRRRRWSSPLQPPGPAEHVRP